MLKHSPAREAVVTVAKGIANNTCRILHLVSILRSATGKLRRDVWLLHDAAEHIEPIQLLGSVGIPAEAVARLHVAPQPTIPKSLRYDHLREFGDSDFLAGRRNPNAWRTGMAKPAFLWWMATQTQYDRAWFVEEDVFFTGAWHRVFDATPPGTDLVMNHHNMSKEVLNSDGHNKWR